MEKHASTLTGAATSGPAARRGTCGRGKIIRRLPGFVFLLFSLVANAGLAGAQTWQWREITPSSGLQPEPRRYGSAIYDPVGRRVIIFGGMGNSGFLNDVWALNLDSNSWSRLQTTGRSPDPRFGHNAVFDAAGYRMVVWAGQSSRFFNDTQALDLRTLEWRDISPAIRPAARYGSASVFDPPTRRLIQFAGFTQEAARFQDTQGFDVQNPGWQDLTPPGVKPEVRCLHTAAFHAESRRMVVYGGQRSGPLDELWYFDLQARVWARLDPPVRPRGRFLAASFVDRRGSFIVFGGSTSSGNVNETWSFNFETGQWTQLQIDGAPSPRNAMMGAYVEAEDRFIVFGGTGAGLMNDVWQLSAGTSDSGRTFSVANRGALTLAAGTDGEATTLGYVRLRSADQSGAPAGISFLRFRQNGAVVSETGIPASAPAMSGRVYAESEGPVQTAIALANPNDRPADVSFFFTDSSGQDFGHGTTQIAPNAQLAAFLKQAPFNAPSSFRGTLTFRSTASIPCCSKSYIPQLHITGFAP